MSRARICFLEGLPTITSIVERFGGVPSNHGIDIQSGCCYENTERAVIE